MGGAGRIYEDIIEAYSQNDGPSLPKGESAKGLLKIRISDLSEILAYDPLSLFILNENKNHSIESYRHMLRVGVLYDSMVHLHSELVYSVPKKTLEIVGFVHDAGKMYIPVRILQKPGKLTDDEIRIMKCHNSLSMTLLRKLEAEYPGISQVAIEHHSYPRTGKDRRYYERREILFDVHFDRRGRADNRKGERRKRSPKIQAAGKILTICDIFDALSSQRTYKKAWSRDEVRRTLENEFLGYKDMVGHLYIMFSRED